MKDKNKKNLLIILNPVAGRRLPGKFNNIVNILQKNGLSITIKETRHAGHGKEIAGENVNEGYDMIIAAGGDGTINEVINGIYPHQIAFGIIPLGTANVLAKEISLGEKANDIADYLINGHSSPCWLGKANGRYFTLMASVGLDSLAVAHVSTRLKKIIGKGAYALSFIWQVIKSKNITYQVTSDGKTHSAYNVIITNGRLYGGQFICAPEARLEDKKLYLLLAQRGGRFNALKYAYLMLSQKYPESRTVTTLPMTQTTIECGHDNIPVQIDGDAIGCLPTNVSLSKYALNLVRPIGKTC
ncbi:MAG: diacylglycerol kinase family lipid kinase [Alphaproteobacteria bacterium]|nr:diacylglycerol kinase family lipid kinase [Alphaproteobacteria bacterium]